MKTWWQIGHSKAGFYSFWYFKPKNSFIFSLNFKLRDLVEITVVNIINLHFKFSCHYSKNKADLIHVHMNNTKDGGFFNGITFFVCFVLLIKFLFFYVLSFFPRLFPLFIPWHFSFLFWHRCFSSFFVIFHLINILHKQVKSVPVVILIITYKLYNF